ncbi:amino acid ABC transporter substrate-binding protein [Streptomyces sp. TRM66268-LWL]|uniref:Amino acid ABC transporter substrate-binding protein n=1 Tax=Streptomyces polyasparticus TaxID=2767826 RepID=A0ABR7SEJ0_9ACTN|nr:ABC transporter substrate-binding protein [Streptomyces polyasparticus]MBC9713155.1 amino acid ABC transporter substrate-binding protein [Streptomyces polyasparticus]
MPGSTIPRNPLRKALWAAAALVLVAGATTAGLVLADEDPAACAPGTLTAADGSCTALSDGGHTFPVLKDISGKIKAENDAVTASKTRHVTVVHLESMAGGTWDRGPEGARRAVTGAYIAQVKLNKARDTVPKVRLLLADTGKDDKDAEKVAGQILALAQREHIVAVTGIGQSNQRTVAAVRKLRAGGMPVVGATVAADEMRSEAAGFFRVSFPVSSQTAAAARYFAQEQDKRPGYRVQVIRDRRPGDVYSKSLYEGFTAAARKAGLRTEDVVPFTSGTKGTDGNALWQVAEKVCAGGQRPDAVYFAGRGRELRRFIEAAGQDGRRCPVTVLSGSSAVGVYFDTSRAADDLGPLHDSWQAGGLTVRYTAYTHPQASQRLYGGARQGPYAAFERDYLRLRGGDPGALANGQAMVGHDALYAVGIASRNAVSSYGADSIGAGAVLDLLGQINGGHTVHGVSGEIAFDPNTGEPEGRPMALVELRAPDTGLDEADLYRFVRLIEP